MSRFYKSIGMKKVKICGLFQDENIKEIATLRPDFLGFIFYPKSKRFVADKLSKEILNSLPKEINKTAVFVNETIKTIQNIVQNYAFDYVQLHGNETVQCCQKLNESNIKIIKAFSVDDAFHFSILEEYQKYCDYFLFDTKTPNYGGSGKAFNWQILQNYHLNTPFFLSGGIGLQNIDDALQFQHLQFIGLDCNSALENQDYTKNQEKVAQIIEKIYL